MTDFVRRDTDPRIETGLWGRYDLHAEARPECLEITFVVRDERAYWQGIRLRANRLACQAGMVREARHLTVEGARLRAGGRPRLDGGPVDPR